MFGWMAVSWTGRIFVARIGERAARVAERMDVMRDSWMAVSWVGQRVG